MTDTTAGPTWLGMTALLDKLGGQDAMVRDPGAALCRLAEGVDDAVGGDVGPRKLLLLVSPELVRELLVTRAGDTTKGPELRGRRTLLGNGLLTSEGDTHRRARRLVAPAFSQSRLRRYAAVMGQRAERRMALWEPGSTIDVHAEMAALTLEIVGETLLGVELADETAPIRQLINSAASRFADQGGPLGGDGPGGVSDDHFEALIAQIIDDHKGSADRGDVVSALLSATDDEAGGGGLTNEEVRDNVVTLLMAGHETTANALSWTFHLLGTHPEIAERLHHEAAGLAGRPPTFDELRTLTYTRAVVTEAMRLFPPAWIIGRSPAHPMTLGRWTVDEQTMVLVSPLVLHSRSQWFPEPEVFDPDRWLDERAEGVPRYTYLPFGAGPRSCIGEQFAWTELVSVLAVLAGSWRFEPVPGHVVNRQYRITLRPEGGLPMIAARW